MAIRSSSRGRPPSHKPDIGSCFSHFPPGRAPGNSGDLVRRPDGRVRRAFRDSGSNTGCRFARRPGGQHPPRRSPNSRPWKIARDAYVYAYPLMLMDVFMRQGTNYAAPTGIVTQAPYNQFNHAKAFPTADFKAVVRANVDTLYSSANLDLGAEPVVLSLPSTDGYFMMPLLSLWTDVFAAPGTRTTGRNVKRDFLIAGPRWQGQVPAGLELIRSPTRFVGIGGRTQTNGVSDYDSVHRMQ